MRLVPINFSDANEFVRRSHRHHKPMQGCKFCIAVEKDSQIVAVAIVGRPVSRMLDNGWTLEVNRLASDGSKNTCSMLYRAAWRAALALGYLRLITYTLPEEGGASLRGSGFKLLGQAGGGSWSRTTRARVDKHPLQTKLLWEVTTETPAITKTIEGESKNGEV